MKRPKCIFFDLGSTILSGSYDPVKGDRAILKRARNPRGVTPEKVQEVAATLDSQIMPLKIQTQLESTTYSFQKLLYDLLEIEVKVTPEQLERLFWDEAFTYAATPGITKVLPLLKKKGFGLAVLSNMTFSGAIIEHELKKHRLLRYFDFVASSSDYGFRKPAKILFEVVLKRAKCLPDQAWYVGDSYDTDVVGASGAGLYPIWYNPRQEMRDSAVMHLEIHSWEDLLNAAMACT